MSCKIPTHILKDLCRQGHSRHLALFLSLKKLYSSSHIHNFKKLDLSKIGYKISRPTYLKYLRVLNIMGLVRGDGKGGMILTGTDTLLKMFPVPDNSKLKFTYLENNEHLKDGIERVTLQRCVIGQDHKKKEISSHNIYANVLTKVGETLHCSYENLRDTTSVSCITLAKMIGYRSAMTGLRRERKWIKDRFLKTQKRLVKVCSKHIDGANAMLRSHPLNFILGENICRPIANAIEIQQPKFGRKKVDVKPMKWIDFYLENF